MDPQILLSATQAFMLSMRRSWISMGGIGQCPVEALESYPPIQRKALMTAIGAAINVATTDNKFKAS